ncbi:MAG: hypothetical protein WC204_01565 [Elusimicrobiales bacterium]|jgi:hypothetical protein
MGAEKTGVRPFDKGAFPGAVSRFIFFLLIAAALCPLIPVPSPLASVVYAQTELGSSDDLTILGVNGTALDPDVEIKGFTVFGSTQSAYPGNIPVLAGNVVVNGYLSVSSGAYFSVNSTFTAANTVFINDGSADQLLAKHSAGYLQWVSSSVPADNLGNHIATTTLTVNFGIKSSTRVSAGYYQVAGSTVLAVLSGTNSLGVGPDAGRVNRGYNNTFVGYDAGYSNTTGSSNTFAGAYAGYNNTTGMYNSFFGAWSGYSNVNGSSNTFAGYKAGYSNTTGGRNTVAGSSAAYYNQSGSANSVFGAHAGGYNGGAGSGSFSSSTIVGYQAGNKLATGSDNILLGWRAGYNITTGTGNIVIGYNQDTSAAAANNELNIGGVYKGNISSGTATIPKRTIEDRGLNPGNLTLTASDFGKTYISTGATGFTYNLPSTTSADIGAQFTFVKLGTGKVTIDPYTGDFIENSSATGVLYNNAVSAAYSSVTIRLINATLWMVISEEGSWTAT